MSAAESDKPFELDASAGALQVAMVSPEIAPFARTGGLGDVLGSLPAALERLGLHLSLFMPAYRPILTAGFPLEDTKIRFSVSLSGNRVEGSLLKTVAGNAIPVYLIRADRYFDREGLYGTPDGAYSDNAERFIFFARAVLEVLRQDPPRILHAHDWQSALVISFMRAQPELYPELSTTRTIFTIHNLGFQGLFGHQDWQLLNLDSRFFSPGYLEFHGKINFIKGGLVFSDTVSTVSPTYAGEIKTAEQGFGLEGLLQERAASLVGILNGVDYSIWNPRTDPSLAENYSAEDLSGKKSCKADLQLAFGLPLDADVPLVGMVSRLTEQKGIDLLQGAMDRLLSRNLQLAIIGTGDSRYEQFFSAVAVTRPDRVGVKILFDDSLAHRVIAGADMFFVPSLYEPSGLTQLYSLKYGTVPVVRATGGLKDSVEEFDPSTGRGNGFLFSAYEVDDFLAAVDRALALFRRPESWTSLMRNGMAADFSWERTALAYLDLYRKLGVTIKGAGQDAPQH